MKRSQSQFSLDEAGGYMGGGSMARFNSEFDLENAVIFVVAKTLTSLKYDIKDAMSFGRPGYGAPMRTKSGKLRSTVYGNTEIRY